MAPLYEQVLEHHKKIIGNPDILLSLDGTHENGALDGKHWKRPAASDAIQRMASGLPHLQSVLVAMFTGGLETWDRFIDE
jgi:hypothetical protein